MKFFSITNAIASLFLCFLIEQSTIKANDTDLIKDNQLFFGEIHRHIDVEDTVIIIYGTGKFYFRVTGQTLAPLFGKRVEVDIPIEMDVYNLTIAVEFLDIEGKGPAPRGYESGDELVALLKQYAGTGREVGITLTNVNLRFSDKGGLSIVTGDHLGIIDPDKPE